MSAVVIAGDTSGSVTLQAPAIAGGTTLNLPAVSVGTLLTTAGEYTMTGGARITSYNLGNLSGASITPNALNSNYQYITGNGAGTIGTPSADCAIDILLQNTTGASTVTFSGYTVVSGNTGDVLTTSTTAKFIISIRRIANISTYVIKQIQT